MSVKRAKELAGKYALCLKIGADASQRFLPSLNAMFDTIEEANDAWRQHEHRARRFVACACRFSRQWELPLYNPLHADPEYAILIGFNNEPRAADTAASYGAAALPLGCLVPAILLTVLIALVTSLWASGIPQKVGTRLHDAALSSPAVLGLLQWVYLFMGLLILGSVFYPILPKPAQRAVAAFYRFVAHGFVWLLSAISGRLARK